MSSKDNSSINNNLSNSSNNSLVGKVKWFNIDLRYGFITILDDCIHKNKDFFIHRNFLKTDLKFKCLFKGEYVLVDICETNNKLQCKNVRGIENGLLLCESNPDLLKKLILGQYIEKMNPNLAYFKMSS
tara:strand:- start:3075 stop:3461 length:387 start_codon:yes stop_codon:yes gene_type:complete